MTTTVSRPVLTVGAAEPIRERHVVRAAASGSCAGVIAPARTVLDGSSGQEQPAALDVVACGATPSAARSPIEADLAVVGTGRNRCARSVFLRAAWGEKAGEDVEVLARVPHTVEAATAAARIVAARQGRAPATALFPESIGDGRVHRLFVGTAEEDVDLEER